MCWKRVWIMNNVTKKLSLFFVSPVASSSFPVKVFSCHAVESFMVKYLLFIIVFLFSFMINISVSKGETGKNIKTNDLDVYYQKTKVFRGWDRKGSSVSKKEKKLFSFYPDQLNKKEEIKKQQSIEMSENKIFKDLLQGEVGLMPLRVDKKVSNTPVADSFLEPSVEPSRDMGKSKTAEREDKVLIYGSYFEQDCYLNKNDCGFPINQDVKQYKNKLTPEKKPVDTTNYPIEFKAD